MLTSRLFGGTPTTFWPCRKTSPSVGSSHPAIIRIVVVLPHPDGPSSEKNSPSPMDTSTPLTAATASPCAWNVLVTPFSSIAASSVPTGVAASFISVTRIPVPSARSAGSRRPGYSPMPRKPHSLSDMAHHVLDPRVVLEPVHRQVLAVPRVLEAAVRHLRRERDVRVDPHGAEVEPLGHAQRAAVVPGPHARRQAVVHAVRPAQRLLLGGETLHGDDRAEDLVLDHLVVLGEPADDRRRVEVAAVADTPPTGHDLGVRGRAVDETGDAGELVRVVERAVEGVLLGRGARPGRRGPLGERGGEVVVDPGTGDHAGGGGAVLAGEEVAGLSDVLGGLFVVVF